MALLKGRGCIVNNPEFCLEKLSLINYYRFTGYLLPFKEGDNYIKGTIFEKIYYIYEFDRKLRNVILQALEVIEVSLRTKLSYFHSFKYGQLGYLDSNNFNKHHNSIIFQGNINTEIQRNKRILFVEHHIKKYNGEFPLWVLVELFSFGMLSYFYSDLHTSDQKEIAIQYNVNFKDLRSWLRCLTDLRNICAHFGRLYYRIFSSSPSNIKLSEKNKRRLWAYMLVLKNVYPSNEKWNSEILPKLEFLFDEYSNYIDSYHIAFPENWIEMLKKYS